MGLILPLLAGVLLIGLYLWSLYNNLITLRMRIKEAWSQIDVQLKRRSDLIPNLVESVKGYVKHEKTVLENVTKARAALMQATGPVEKAMADNQLAGALKSLFAVAEAYPQLKANENFLQLQNELTDTEDKVAYSRQFYNTSVAEFNTKIQIFPNVLIANNLGFKEEQFFTATEEEKKKVEVKF
jgi:LemA protein